MNATAITYIHKRVKDCLSCLFSTDHGSCLHPCNTDGVEADYDGPPPANCPLRKTSVIVKLETT